MRRQMKTTRGFDMRSKERVVFICFFIGIKTHARDEFSHFLLVFKLMNY